MKYIKNFESKKHKYKIGDWVFVNLELNIEEEKFSGSGEIIETEYLPGGDLCYIVDFFINLPEELDYSKHGDDNSTRYIVTQSEIERLLNEKEIEIVKIKKAAKKYNL